MCSPSFLQQLWQEQHGQKATPPATLTPHGQGQPRGWCRAQQPARQKQTSASPPRQQACGAGPGPGSTQHHPRRAAIFCLGLLLPSRGSQDPVSPETQRSWPRAQNVGVSALGNKIHDGGVNCQQAERTLEIGLNLRAGKTWTPGGIFPQHYFTRGSEARRSPDGLVQ